MAARTSLLLIAVMEVSGLLACACAADPPAGPSFRADVAPILVRKCLGCHNDKKAEGGLDISTYARLRRGGTAAGDLIIEPGDPDSSYLIESVRGGAARAMPLKQPRLKAQEIAILARWVEQGRASMDLRRRQRSSLRSSIRSRDCPKFWSRPDGPRRSAPWPRIPRASGWRPRWVPGSSCSTWARTSPRRN